LPVTPLAWHAFPISPAPCQVATAYPMLQAQPLPRQAPGFFIQRKSISRSALWTDSENVPASLLMADTRQVSSERHRSSSPAIACPTWRHVCFAPKSGHVRCTGSCLLWAKSGHASNLARESRDALVGQPASRLNWTFGLDFRYFGVTSRAAAGALRHERSAHPEHATGRDLNRH
jgi:hypothetical protein